MMLSDTCAHPVACAFCKANLLGKVDERSRGQSLGHCSPRYCSPGEVIYRQGQTGRFIYSVCRGLVKLDQHQSDGTQRTVRMLPPGGVFGLEALAEGTYQHSVFSVGRSRICRIPVEVIAALSQHEPATQSALMKQWSQTLDEADFVIARLSTGTARQRVMALLQHLCEVDDEEGVCQAPPRDDMASLLGLTSETVSRTVAALKREGVLTESAGIFSVNLSRWQALADRSETDSQFAPLEK